MLRPRRPLGHRSYSEYIPGREILVETGTISAPVHQTILLAYLPGLLNFSTHPLANHVSLAEVMRQNPMYTRKPWFQTTMYDAMETLVRSLSRNVDRLETTERVLLDWLEDSLTDRYMGQIPYHRYALTYERFLCLAMIAAYAVSSRLLSILAHFFTKHGGGIVRREVEEEAVFAWCKTIIAYIRFGSDRVPCLSEIILNRENILYDLTLVDHNLKTIATANTLRIVKEQYYRMLDQENDPVYAFEDVPRRGRSAFRAGEERMLMPPTRPRMARPLRHRSTSPPRRRLVSPAGLTIERIETNAELVPRRRAMSHSDGQRLRLLEQRMHEAEEAVIWIANEHLSKKEKEAITARRWRDSEDEFF